MTTAASVSAAPFYVGTYTRNDQSKGIYHGTLDPDTGQPGNLTLAGEAPNPSWVALSPDGKYLYSALEDANPGVGAFRVEADGRLVALNRLPSEGDDPCHVSVDRTGKFVFVANYTGGNIAAFAVRPDGSLGERTALVNFQGSGPNPERQKKPYAHAIVASPDNRFVYACDLGSDKVWIFRFDAEKGSLAPAEPAFGSVPGGNGPRHLAFANGGKFVYVANELGLTVTAFRRDAASGALEPIQTIPAHPETPSGEVSLAEIEVHPNGKWLYVSSRGDDTLAVFSIGSDGRLALIESVPAGVKIPRGFAIDPSGKWLLAAGAQDNRLVTFRIDPKSGTLTPTGATASVGKPVCIVFAR